MFIYVVLFYVVSFKRSRVCYRALFVDSIGLAALPKLNAEDINSVTVAEKMADMFNKIEVMNDAIAVNTVRSIDSEKFFNCCKINKNTIHVMK